MTCLAARWNKVLSTGSRGLVTVKKILVSQRRLLEILIRSCSRPSKHVFLMFVANDAPCSIDNHLHPFE